MAVRLGELLVRKGLLGEKQLKQALEAQLIYGSHLGTCLIELGFISEIDLGAALAEASGCRFASGEMFESIPPEVINLVPARMAERHNAIPFHARGKVLHIAMVDPRNILALDELSFATAHAVQPWITPEVRIYQALERYYEVPRKVRYISLYNRLDQEKKTRRAPGHEAVEVATQSAAAEGPEHSRADDPSGIAAHSPVQVSSARRGEPASDPLEELSDLFCRAEDEDQVVDAALNRLYRAVPRCLFLSVKSGVAKPLRMRGVSLSASRMSLEFPLTTEPLFSLLHESNHYRGPLPDDPGHRRFFEALGLGVPAELILIPIYCSDHLVGLFYGDAGEDLKLQGETAHYLRFMKKLSTALGIVLLKRKLRSI